VGRYAIVRRLSRGMTDVYLAVDTAADREVALKLIACAPDALAQMTLEAERRGAAIQQELHALDPRVIEVYEYGDADGYFFVAMQYVDGANLAQILHTERRLEVRRAARVALEVADQLAAFRACRDGVVHGDIKPSNIHIGPGDSVRLLDFGIAKMLRADRDATLHNFGSPGYCSPERLARLQVDHQSDLWALGATLYEMLAGRPPYQAEDTQKLEKVIQARRPPRALPEDCPAGLRAIIAKALAPDPAQRYQTAVDLRDELEAFLQGRRTAAEDERRIRWSSPPTLEVAREYLRRATASIPRRVRGWRSAEGAIWFVLGMGLWIGGTAALQAWKGAVERARPPLVLAAPSLPPSAPAPQPAPDVLAILRAEYLRTADRVIDGYRTGGESQLRDFDWRLAETSLERLVELGARDDEILGKLALSRGYSLLSRSLTPYYVEAALDAFTLAASRLPRSPDPQLGLARLYVYGRPDIDKAFAAMRAAATLGYKLGPREIEQQADAWRMRAERTHALGRYERARRDAERARALYAQLKHISPNDKRLRSLRRISARPYAWY
jgi:serine/threonine-protein kinase